MSSVKCANFESLGSRHYFLLGGGEVGKSVVSQYNLPDPPLGFRSYLLIPLRVP